MILHFLKVGARNLIAYKTQTFVSLFGLAMAFACTSLASYWNYYERTYDAFQENAGRIYRISCNGPSGIGVTNDWDSPYSLHSYLKEKYPEVEAACAIASPFSVKSKELNAVKVANKVSMNGISSEAVFQKITSETLDIFGFEWVEGHENVMAYHRNQVAISEKLAQILCQNSSPLGKIIKINDVFKYEVAGVYKARPQHSNVKFDVIMPIPPIIEYGWNVGGYQTYVLLKEGVNHEHFIRKLQNDTIREKIGSPTIVGLVVPLTEMRLHHPDAGVNVALEDVSLFTMAAVALSLCALLNYLTLFISRLRTRGRDMALRVICGSSEWQLGVLLLMEYLLLLLAASLIGMLFVEIAMRPFMELAMIQIAFSSVMVSCVGLMAFSMVLAVLLSVFPIFYFKRKTLRVQIEAVSIRLGRNYFHSIGVCVQLIIGFLFIFCMMVMMKQVYMLTSVDNIERKQVACILTGQKERPIIRSFLQQHPFIKTILDFNPLFPVEPFIAYPIESWDGKSADESGLKCDERGINDEIARFYGLKMKEGDSSFDLGENEVLINETLAKQMNLDNPVGKFIKNYGKIKGVVCDYQIQNPNTPPYPILYKSAKPSSTYLTFKYDGDWKTCKNKLLKELQEKNIYYSHLTDGEEYYQSFLKSEYNLLKLLSIITIVSVLIAIFGVYALVMQSCDQHQKEIAVRKVFGAQVSDILLMFFKQYMLQVVVAAVIAFPVGFFLMKNWLQQYARQTEISIWIYFGIFMGISMLVTLCIGWRVWKAANENPAVVIKKE